MRKTVLLTIILLLSAAWLAGQQMQDQNITSDRIAHAAGDTGVAVPFPQAANPALANSTNQETSSGVNLPPAMATNEASTSADLALHAAGDTGSALPFPEAANPALTNNENQTTSPEQGVGLPSAMAANQAEENTDQNYQRAHAAGDTGVALPFPQAAKPALNTE